jgi:hypothetical protein
MFERFETLRLEERVVPLHIRTHNLHFPNIFFAISIYLVIKYAFIVDMNLLIQYAFIVDVNILIQNINVFYI